MVSGDSSWDEHIIFPSKFILHSEGFNFLNSIAAKAQRWQTLHLKFLLNNIISVLTVENHLWWKLKKLKFRWKIFTYKIIRKHFHLQALLNSCLLDGFMKVKHCIKSFPERFCVRSSRAVNKVLARNAKFTTWSLQKSLRDEILLKIQRNKRIKEAQRVPEAPEYAQL